MTDTRTAAELSAELENLEDKRFAMSMKDRWDSDDRQYNADLSRRSAEVKKQLAGPEPQIAITPPSKEEKAALWAEYLRTLVRDDEAAVAYRIRLDDRMNGKSPYDPNLLPRKAG